MELPSRQKIRVIKLFDLYQCDKKDRLRFILGKEGAKKLFVIGLNPSTANKEKTDTTAAKVEQVALQNGFDGFVMANLYPLRSTDPKGLHKRKNTELFESNLHCIFELARKERELIIWAAWGGDIESRRYLRESFFRLEKMIKKLGGRWIHYGQLRKDGHPRHPSRLSYAWQFQTFDTSHYLGDLK